jgi:c-di-GMP-related signal transduction protein
MKDGEIIEIEKNCYVNIQSEALTRDVLELFGEENLIILK